MKIARWGAARNHGVETKAFTHVSTEFDRTSQEVRIRSARRKSDFGSGQSDHFYRVALSSEDIAMSLATLAKNVNNLDDDDRKNLRVAVPDLVYLVNALSTP